MGQKFPYFKKKAERLADLGKQQLSPGSFHGVKGCLSSSPSTGDLMVAWLLRGPEEAQSLVSYEI